MDVDISVIISTYNRGERLGKTLDALENLKTSDGMTHEIILVDNASTDGTRELIDSFAKRYPDIWRYYCEPRKGKCNAVNFGISRARGKILAFTDHDVAVHERWLDSLWNPVESTPDVLAGQGRLRLEKDIERLPPWVDPDELLFCTHYDPGTTPHYTDTLIGANMAFRRRAFEKYGLFDPRLGPGASGSGEDTEFCMRLIDAGEKIYYQPEALIYHEYDEERFTWEYWCQRQKQSAQSWAIIDVELRHKKVSPVEYRKKLLRYRVKRFLYALTGNRRKRHKYERRILYFKSYIEYASKLQNT